MWERIPTGNMSRTEWLKLRKTGIGGSDAGAVCGLNPYSSPMKVFQDKISDHTEEEDNEPMRIGRDLEEYVVRRFVEETGLKVRRSNYMYRSTENPFMIADVDRLIIGTEAGLECKTANAYQADKWKNNETPAHYVVQCQHYMAVTGKKEWFLAVLILGVGFQFRRIPKDDALIRGLVSIEKYFWNQHVLKRTMPDPDGSKTCDEVLEQYFHESKKGTSIPLIGFDDRLRRREELDQMINRLSTEKNQIDQEIKMYMGEHEAAFNEKYRISWTNVNSLRLDTKRMKEERPEIYREFSNPVSSRRFSVKAA